MKANKIHLTIGVYNNGDYKYNGVSSENLEAHIKYNLDFRPGRALIVDWEIIHEGYLNKERLNEFIERNKFIIKVPDCDNAPYV